MISLSKLQQVLYENLKVHSGRERRQFLINEMESLNTQKIHCFNCVGTCCTFSANSMQITPIEALEIIISLEINENNISEIKERLIQNIKDYRLDHEIFLGKKNIPILRKTYSCPFFVAGAKGCTIKKDLKPYGCLGFNPKIENDNGGSCYSNTELLELRENTEGINEHAANSFLKNELKLDWGKLEIPKAVLALLNILFS